jgi:hypothetical protein
MSEDVENRKDNTRIYIRKEVRFMTAKPEGPVSGLATEPNPDTVEYFAKARAKAFIDALAKIEDAPNSTESNSRGIQQ